MFCVHHVWIGFSSSYMFIKRIVAKKGIMLKFSMWLRIPYASSLRLVPEGFVFVMGNTRHNNFDFHAKEDEGDEAGEGGQRVLSWKLSVKIWSTLCSPFFFLSLEKIQRRKSDWWAHFLPHQQLVAGVGVGIMVRRLIDMISKGGTLRAWK